MPVRSFAAGAVEQQRYAMLLQAEQLMVGRVAERHLLVQVSEPVKNRVRGGRLWPRRRPFRRQCAGCRRAKSPSRCHRRTACRRYAGNAPRTRPRRLAGGLPGAAQVQDLPQVQAFQLGTVSGALQRIRLQPPVQQPAAHMAAIGSAVAPARGNCRCPQKRSRPRRCNRQHSDPPFCVLLLL